MRKIWFRRFNCVAIVGLLLSFSLLIAFGTEQRKKDVRDTKTGKTLYDTAKGNKSADATFDGRRHNDPVSVDKSTTTKVSPIGQPVKEYKPPQKPLKIKEPPPPNSTKDKPRKVSR